MAEEKRLSKKVINLYGLPSFGFQIFVNLEMFFLMAFLTDYAKLPMAIAGTVLMLTSIMDLIFVPTAGVIVEKSNMKWGKYRSWLLVGPPIAVLFYTLEFTNFGSPMLNAVLITIGFGISHLIWNTYYTAHAAMNNSMTTVREERISMSTLRGMYNSFGSIIISAVGLPLILFLGKSTGDKALGFTLTALVTGIVMMLCYWVLFSLTKDYAHHGTGAATGQAQEKLTIGEMLKTLVLNPPLIGLMIGELGRFMGRFIIFGLAFYYFKYVVNNLAVVTIFMTGLSAITIVGAMIANPVAKKIGERNTYLSGQILFIICLLVVWAIPMTYISFMGVMWLGYIGYGIADALGIAMYSSTVEYGEWKTGKNARGFIMSLYSLPIKAAVILRSIAITSILAGAGYVANMQATPQLISGIVKGITLIPAVCLIVSVVMLFLLYKITPEGMSKIQKEIAERKKVVA